MGLEYGIVDARKMTAQGKLHINESIREELGWDVDDALILILDKRHNRLIVKKAKL